jgi:hypothetical protein
MGSGVWSRYTALVKRDRWVPPAAAALVRWSGSADPDGQSRWMMGVWDSGTGGGRRCPWPVRATARLRPHPTRIAVHTNGRVIAGGRSAWQRLHFAALTTFAEGRSRLSTID